MSIHKFLAALASLFICASLPLAPSARADATLLESLHVPLVAGTAVIECQSNIPLPATAESECVGPANGRASDPGILDAYREQLSENRWLLVYGSGNQFIVGRWLNDDCVERLFVLAPSPGTIQFVRREPRACGNERYNGDNGPQVPSFAALSNDLLFPDSMNMHRVKATATVDCPPSNSNASNLDAVCVRLDVGIEASRELFTYFDELSKDQWIFNNTVPPGFYLFSRWQSANCIERIMVIASDEPANTLMFGRFRTPACGTARYGPPVL